VDVREQAVEVVDRMGILPQVRAAATDVRRMKFVDAHDHAVARVDVTGASEIEVMRGDLVALVHQASECVDYVFGDAVRGLAQDDDGVTVSFENGPDRRFDLVIGADGLHSAVRRLAFGPEANFVQHGGHYFAFANATSARTSGWYARRSRTRPAGASGSCWRPPWTIPTSISMHSARYAWTPGRPVA
jgi:2-polyprenyl-6-methoxyphenol hydroxylase-like FAD-dependent oxidoreductase